MTTLEQLEAAWAEWLQPKGTSGPSQGENWRKANPGVWNALKAYRAGAGPRPTISANDHTGQEHLILTDAWLELVPQFPEPAEPRPPFTVREGGGTVNSFPDCMVSTASPVTIKGKDVRNVRQYGVGSQQPWNNGLPIVNPGRTTLEDCIVENVRMPQPGSMGGTGEACAWIGNPTDAKRLKLRGAGWMCMNLVGRSQTSVIEDVEMGEAPVGGYIEHATHSLTIRRCSTDDTILGAPVAGGSEPNGILAGRSWTSEWWYRDPVYGNQLIGPYDVTWEDCPIYCPAPDRRFTGFDPTSGNYIGPGCYGYRFLRCRFFGPGIAVYAPTKRANNGPDVFFDDCTFDNALARVKYHDLAMGA